MTKAIRLFNLVRITRLEMMDVFGDAKLKHNFFHVSIHEKRIIFLIFNIESDRMMEKKKH